MSKRLIFVTGNSNKLKEVKAILSEGGHPIEIDSQSLDIDEIQGTTQEVAKAKCRRAAELTGSACITEDTALCYAALNGLPGPYIKYFMAEVGHEGLNNLLAGFENKAAWALCTFAYSAGPGCEPILFEGRTEGKIVPARGPKVFGWDAVFEPDGTAMTYAEMPAEQKNKLSHRYKALEKLRAYLQTLPAHDPSA
ncbi:putative pyrophosphatase that hydrolyzes non-canonical purine nucleotides such as inosine triphosphate (ITP), deoxyinosine triphosphate (dITP) or xanthosine 5'-triphosphate (XTP) to their respective monophosphate derivatives [Lyophyllum shimeji]|uniref:Inosine triphosphate pyrophosphatase n=1 Tax=Lyophyllum shimeji TaxID=47721 RepID=A0A9P3PE76_LYOSH|nr:putative pyrophosphatase that hydrolyzes non-canonical purine nucleotides such as inosine triphosphate (ITP), deoxyinosine triphosphate (dITP) or xanthosine 5'-triphosphate (XTP) to their respective monophosphate derivatives [Lyophyllum shimeji]